MPLSRNFKETVQKRAEHDPEFRNALFKEAVEALLIDELEIGKALLRDYINATIGFEALAHLTGAPPKSLMRMLSTSGNPRARNFFLS
jgi:DNA-binding phage protein